ncbi:glycerol-3-phosphate 1-O-acyltransferase PlsB [Rheinheimera sp. 4Y26]|uniref:glycerol-3-phosphate 1-O-acyltransferase PlsB n=1 Tax=Rheinheimera sp. 4Y26 TaxID=2977811 RepID=UPI0021B0F018|nr:glycerol-3-phosphate 1-O-acyltransferase PlsB [Rheinheimera sp. 4Y26]MCT6700998.1 glycerol-3-phosphate 1-O-acyltransferase PlsB [Rheinheimera sp. 4Y26]
MFARLKWFASVLQWPLRPLVKYKIIPAQPASSLELNLNKPLFYISRVASASDLATLKRACLQLGLPDPAEQVHIGNVSLPRTLFLQQPTPLWGTAKASLALQQGQKLLQAHLNQPDQDAQLVPVAISWGRAPGKEASVKSVIGEAAAPGWLRKLFVVLISGRHTLVQFSRAVSLKDMASEHGASEESSHKLLRVARFHFYRQQLAATGPRQPNRAALFNALLGSEALKKAIADEAKSKNISLEQARVEARKLLEEIAADYRESTLRVGDRLLSWLWRKLFSGIKIHNAEVIRDLAQRGHEVVYLPCHRSHMDYLLLSYVIYQQGLAAPHIAAGINLDFWPVGKFFRRGGAFFIRRSFSGNKLYSAVFREYLSQLFRKGYSVKYYSEGGRSRTGRLLQPKTGMLAMTVQALLRGIDRPVTLVPVYLGYEHVMEVSTYLRELKGSAKTKESALGILQAIRQLRDYGYGYVNFGEPISLNSYLQQHAPDWRQSINPVEPQKPQWLNPVVAKLAHEVMTKVNQTAALNAINLIATTLLATEQHVLTRKALVAQLDLYLALQQQAPYHASVTLPEGNGSNLVQHALDLHKIHLQQDEFGDLIQLSAEEAVVMSYYRNNVSHLFVIPALLATALLQHRSLSKMQLLNICQQLQPLLQQELFLASDDLSCYVGQVLAFLQQQGMIEEVEHSYQCTDSQNPAYHQLQLLAHNSDAILQRYAMVLNLIALEAPVQRAELEQHSQQLAQRLLKLHGIESPEYHDKQLFATLVNALKEAHYIQLDEQYQLTSGQNFQPLLSTVNALLQPEVLQSIQQITANKDSG